MSYLLQKKVLVFIFIKTESLVKKINFVVNYYSIISQ